ELMDYVRGNLPPKPQDHSQATYAKKLSKSESVLNWSGSAESLHNKTRAFTMGPGVYTLFKGKKIKIHRTKYLSDLSDLGEFNGKENPVKSGKTSQPGCVVIAGDGALLIETGRGYLQILELQPESRNRLSAQ